MQTFWSEEKIKKSNNFATVNALFYFHFIIQQRDLEMSGTNMPEFHVLHRIFQDLPKRVSECAFCVEQVLCFAMATDYSYRQAQNYVNTKDKILFLR